MKPDNLWMPLDTSNESREKIWAQSRSFSQDVWFRFRKKPTAILGLVMLVLVSLFSIFGPFFTPFTYSQQNLQFANIAPRLPVTTMEDFDNVFYITHGLRVVEITPQGQLVRQLLLHQDDFNQRRMIFTYDDYREIILDYTERPLMLLDQNGERIASQGHVWNRTYRFGTDHLGRDILTRLMFGGRISFIIALVAVLANMVIGTLYGSISGYFGGVVDDIMMRIVDIINTIPVMLYVILIKVAIGSGGLAPMIIALSSVYWVSMARVVRGQVLSLRAQEFVLASRTIGTSTKEIVFRHLVPNTMGPILVTATMLIPTAIFLEAFMSFIGIGIAPPMASLGTMSNDATAAMRSAPYQLFMPAALICILMFAFSFAGDGLRDALDPKLKK
ncbi:MAG: ABC transporter permease [Defluviitaleaceae bacterium]|nr:ABC transporter permease [Defluviitaleaceae bacterium]